MPWATTLPELTTARSASMRWGKTPRAPGTPRLDGMRSTSYVSGYNNTATGIAALEGNGAGIGNTATGVGALANNGKGKTNTATGLNALYNNAGNDNTAIGAYALQDNSTGASNIGIGVEAGFYLTTGSNNIEIGNQGAAADADTIRIGTEGTQTATYIAGIFNTTVTGGCTVVAASTGQLGCVTSSARYKRDVRDMGDASDKLMKLRPVTFLYKADETGAQQYGLIAEERASPSARRRSRRRTTGGGRRDGPPASGGAKRVMPPNPGTRKYRPAHLRHGRAGCASASR
jgi:hypothetical protein